MLIDFHWFSLICIDFHRRLPGAGQGWPEPPQEKRIEKSSQNVSEISLRFSMVFLIVQLISQFFGVIRLVDFFPRASMTKHDGSRRKYSNRMTGLYENIIRPGGTGNRAICEPRWLLAQPDSGGLSARIRTEPRIREPNSYNRELARTRTGCCPSINNHPRRATKTSYGKSEPASEIHNCRFVPSATNPAGYLDSRQTQAKFWLGMWSASGYKDYSPNQN